MWDIFKLFLNILITDMMYLININIESLIVNYYLP